MLHVGAQDNVGNVGELLLLKSHNSTPEDGVRNDVILSWRASTFKRLPPRQSECVREPPTLAKELSLFIFDHGDNGFVTIVAEVLLQIGDLLLQPPFKCHP
jgi:hypothetical protein